MSSRERVVDAGPAGVVRRGVAMAGHTAWGVGGVAERVFEPAEAADLTRYLEQLGAHEPLLWLGLGSNLLVRDGGVRGTVILTPRGLGGIELLGGGRIRVEAGVPGAKLARTCAASDLVGVEFLAGIPGTVGGALAMNAGAFGGEIWPLVEAVQTVDRQGKIRRREAREFDVAYRHVAFPPDAAEEWFLAAELTLTPGDGNAARARMRALLQSRSSSQPTGQRSCGSVFKNPPGDFAGRLVESAGLKGARVGGAVVSERHANFIINDGTATAGDVEALIRHVAAVVEERHGVRLVPEVRIVGEPAR